MVESGKLVGIDLGTTYSAIATLDDHGQPITLPNRDGDMLTPSAVLLLDDGGAVVGQAALDVALENPDRVASLIKRRMGYPSFGRTVADREFRPETLSAIILRKLVQDAELRIGPIHQAVITVPAYFDDTRRKATQDAGRIAGLDVIDVLDEPTAAALAYSFQPQPGARGAETTPLVQLPGPERTVLVYDLGGGTFDVTLVRLAGRRFQCLAIEGDVRLGGKDWDDRIVEYVANQFASKYGADPRSNSQSLANLASAAERAKRTLSKLPQTSVTCSHEGKMLTVPLSRQDFESLTRDLLVRTRLTAQHVLRQAGLSWEQVDQVLLVGGSTHMPMTRQMLQELSGKQPNSSLAVSEVVARGAALHAGILATQQSAPQGGQCPHAPPGGWKVLPAICSARWSRSMSTPTAWASRCATSNRNGSTACWCPRTPSCRPPPAGFTTRSLPISAWSGSRSCKARPAGLRTASPSANAGSRSWPSICRTTRPSRSAAAWPATA